MSENIVRFEVGQIYYSLYPYQNSKGEVVEKKQYWLCVKRNDKTKYVSFKRIYNGKVSSSVDSRKVEIQYNWRNVSRLPCEAIRITYDGYPHYISADQQ